MQCFQAAGQTFPARKFSVKPEMLRKVVAASPLLAAAAVKEAGSEKGYLHTYEGGAKKEASVQPLLFKPSELPLYKSARPAR